VPICPKCNQGPTRVGHRRLADGHGERVCRRCGEPLERREHVRRLRERYRSEIGPRFMRDLGVKNALAVPRLEKIVSTWGSARRRRIRSSSTPRRGAGGDLRAEARVTRAKKAIANFKLREACRSGPW